MTTFEFNLWPGIGPFLSPAFSVEADCLEQAFERLAAQLIDKDERGLYIDEAEAAEMMTLNGWDEMPEDAYMYIDGTMEGARFPIYISTELVYRTI